MELPRRTATVTVVGSVPGLRGSVHRLEAVSYTHSEPTRRYAISYAVVMSSMKNLVSLVRDQFVWRFKDTIDIKGDPSGPVGEF